MKIELRRLPLVLFLLSLYFSFTAGFIHDDSFKPDGVLSVTLQNVSLGGIQRPTTLINGSVPGPVLRVPEDQVAWIRVYNDMKHQNLTMVG